MKRLVALLTIPFLLIGAEGVFLNGQIAPTTTYTYADATVIHLPCGIDLDTRIAEPSLPANLILTDEQEGIGTYLVQLDGPIFPEEQRALENTGALIDGYLPNYTYIVRMDQATRIKVEAIPYIRWTGDYQPGYKICPEIDLDEQTPREFIVLLYAGSQAESIRPTVEDLDGNIVEWATNERGAIVLMNLAPEKITSLVHEPEIKWIEPYHLPYLLNGNAQWVIQTWDIDNRGIWGKGLTGEGQVLASLDSGIRTTHNFFRDPSISIDDFGDYPDHRKIIAYQKSIGTVLIQFGDESGHGTHTAGSLLGNDKPVGGSSANIGMAPDAKFYFLDGGGTTGGIIIGANLETVLNKAYTGNSGGEARIISNSWANQTTRAYDTRCVHADRTMWGHPDYLVAFGGGNTDKGPYTGSPGNAKNVLCAGGCQNAAYANFTWNGSSPGPAGDGRIRPDIVTPGENVASSWYTGDAAEVAISGTSMSCPIAAGNAGLIRQYFTDGYYPFGTAGGYEFTPSAALLKAMMINSAETDYFNHPVPDDNVGWGRPNLDNALYFPGDSRRLVIRDYQEGLPTGTKFSTEIEVNSSAEPLRITLNWTDYPGEAFASPALVNDLNLIVTSPSEKIYRGNNFGTNNESVEGGPLDELNPTENVFCTSPELGIWSIEVQANNVPEGPQPFALVVTGSASIDGIKERKNISLDPFTTLQVIGSIFTNHLTLVLSLPSAGPLTLEMFNATGRKVRTLIDERMYPYGSQEYTFSATDESGNPLSAGVYFLRLQTSGTKVVSKVLHLK